MLTASGSVNTKCRLNGRPSGKRRCPYPLTYLQSDLVAGGFEDFRGLDSV